MKRIAVALLLSIPLHAQIHPRVQEAIDSERRNAIRPDVLRVAEAAQSPETLWALLVDPATTYDDRMHAATLASKVLPPRYIPILAAMREEVNSRSPWNLAPPTNTIEEWRTMPWEWQMERALRKIRIEAGVTPAIDVLRDVPCTNERDARVMVHTLWEFPQMPETFGIMRNLVLRHGGRIHLGWYSDAIVAPDHAEWGAQAFVADLAPEADRNLLFSLSRQVGHMRKGKTSYTALLAVAERLNELALDPDNHEWVSNDAAALMPEFDAWQLHEWLEEHRAELEKGSAAERIAIETARARMLAVTLCR